MSVGLLALSVLYLLVQTHAKDCPSAELYKTLEKHVLDIDPKTLEGTWMDVMVPKVYLDTVASSYSIFNLEKDGKTLKVEGHDLWHNGKNDIYYNIFTKNNEGRKGSFTFTGSYVGGKEFVKQAYFFYLDKNVIGFYSCDVDIPVESGWDLFILVNGDKRKEFQAQKDTSEVMMSFKKAKAVMDEIAKDDQSWERKSEDEFGLIGEMGQVDLDVLRVHTDTDVHDTEDAKSSSVEDQSEASHTLLNSQNPSTVETASSLSSKTGSSNTATSSSSSNPSADKTEANIPPNKDQAQS